MDMSDMDSRLRRGALPRTGIMATLVAVIGLVDAKRVVARDDGVCVGATRDRVDGYGDNEGEVEESEQEEVTSVDRHSDKGVEGIAERLERMNGKSTVFYTQRTAWNPSGRVCGDVIMIGCMSVARSRDGWISRLFWRLALKSSLGINSDGHCRLSHSTNRSPRDFC